MTPLESTLALCQTGIAVCAAFLLFYAVRWWYDMLLQGREQRLLYAFARCVRKQTRSIKREIAMHDLKWRK